MNWVSGCKSSTLISVGTSVHRIYWYRCGIVALLIQNTVWRVHWDMLPGMDDLGWIHINPLAFGGICRRQGVENFHRIHSTLVTNCKNVPEGCSRECGILTSQLVTKPRLTGVPRKCLRNGAFQLDHYRHQWITENGSGSLNFGSCFISFQFSMLQKRVLWNTIHVEDVGNFQDRSQKFILILKFKCNIIEYF